MRHMHGNSLKTLRKDLLAQRKQFAANADYVQTIEVLLSHLQHYLESFPANIQTIALYWPIQEEVDVRATLLAWAKAVSGRQLSLPFARPDKHLDFYTWQDGDALILSQHGIPEPDPNNPHRAQVAPDCILIPCVAWSTSKKEAKTHYWRLGYGGGYFDRTLAQLRQAKPALICVGIGFNWQQLDDGQWQAQTHDEPLDALLTESGLLC
jgi:5,10-methenyltetrahydrofolate synthetase